MLWGLGWRSGPFPREIKGKTLFLTQRNCYLREASGFGAELTAGSVDTDFDTTFPYIQEFPKPSTSFKNKKKVFILQLSCPDKNDSVNYWTKFGVMKRHSKYSLQRSVFPLPQQCQHRSAAAEGPQSLSQMSTQP